MKLYTRILTRHRMKSHRLSYEEYSLLVALQEKPGDLKAAVEAVTQARGSRPLLNSTLKEYTLQLVLHLIRRRYLEKNRTHLYVTPLATAAIERIGPPEPFLLEEYCTPARASRISVIAKSILLLFFIYGSAVGGSLSLLAATAFLLLDFGSTIYFSHAGEQGRSKGTAPLILLGLLLPAAVFLGIQGGITALPLPRTYPGLLFIIHVAVAALILIRFPLRIKDKKQEQRRRLVLKILVAIAGIILAKGFIDPLPVRESLFSAGIGFFGFLAFFALYLYQHKTGRRYTSFPMIHLARTSRTYATLAFLAALTGFSSYLGIYHPDFIYAGTALWILHRQLTTAFRLAASPEGRSGAMELWLEYRTRAAARDFLFIWTANLLHERPATKSDILAVHARCYGKQKAPLTQGLAVQLDHDGSFAGELDICLSNLLYDRTLCIEQDKFTRTL